MRKSQLNRRLFLKGTGSVLIGLPLLEELLFQKTWAQTNALPERLITMSFGLGIEKPLQDEGWNGPLEPFKNVASKGVFFSNLRNDHLRGNDTNHFDVGAAQFTGVPQIGRLQAGGPSIEQIMRRHFHSGAVPTLNGLPSKSAGIWSRTGAVPQYVRHWNNDGSPGEIPERRPSKVFDSIFGSIHSGSKNTNPELEKELRIRRSVLDSVIADYQSMIGPISYLGQESKQKISNHLDTIRAIESSLIDGDLAATEIEGGENNLNLPLKSDFTDPADVSFYDAQSGSQTGPIVPWQAAQEAFRLSGKLFALALSMDALRFGSMIFVGSGEHLRFSGNYAASNIGQSLDFSKVFETRSPHDGIFHNYVQSSVRVYQHYVISQLAYVLDEMDAIVEPNGKTLLENTLVVIGTEYGHNHDGTKEIFHAIFGGNGKFKPGTYHTNWGYDDVYKTALDAYQVTHQIGGSRIDEILV